MSLSISFKSGKITKYLHTFFVQGGESKCHKPAFFIFGTDWHTLMKYDFCFGLSVVEQTI
jgi:hypothetical protein